MDEEYPPWVVPRSFYGIDPGYPGLSRTVVFVQWKSEWATNRYPNRLLSPSDELLRAAEASKQIDRFSQMFFIERFPEEEDDHDVHI